MQTSTMKFVVQRKIVYTAFMFIIIKKILARGGNILHFLSFARNYIYFTLELRMSLKFVSR